MPSFTIPISHKLGQEEALKRLKIFAAQNVKRLPSAVSGLEINWLINAAEFRLSYNSIKISGKILIDGGSIKVIPKVPLIFLPLKNQISKMIKEEAVTILK